MPKVPSFQTAPATPGNAPMGFADLTADSAVVAQEAGRQIRMSASDALLRWQSSDFYTNNTGQNNPFVGLAINSGVSNLAADASMLAAHPGITLLRSSLNANSGYNWRTNDTLRGGGNLSFRAILRQIQTNTQGCKIGFSDITGAATPTAGAWIEGVSNLQSRTVNGGSITTQVSSTPSNSDWRVYDIVFNGSTVRFVVRTMGGEVLMDHTHTTNVPVSTTHLFRAGVWIINEGSSAIDLALLDYMGVGPAFPFQLP